MAEDVDVLIRACVRDADVIWAMPLSASFGGRLGARTTADGSDRYESPGALYGLRADRAAALENRR